MSFGARERSKMVEAPHRRLPAAGFSMGPRRRSSETSSVTIRGGGGSNFEGGIIFGGYKRALVGHVRPSPSLLK